jgi:hypothetical protein
MIASAETTSLAAAKTFLADLAAHLGRLLGRIDTARATLARCGLDTDTLTHINKVRNQTDAMATTCTDGVTHLTDYHAQMEQAVNNTPEAADTDFYRPGATAPGGGSTPSDLAVAARAPQEATVTPPSPPAGADLPREPARLIHDDPSWWYLGHGITSATRRIRTYEQPDGRLIAVVTESGDGTSITNAAETVIAQIRAEHPGRQVEVIEHNPASTLSRETFDRIDLTPAGHATWTRLPAEHIGDMLGPGVFTNGADPSPRIRNEDEGDGWYLEAQGGALDGRRVHLIDPDDPADN